jgi:hypothetical protein
MSERVCRMTFKPFNSHFAGLRVDELMRDKFIIAKGNFNELIFSINVIYFLRNSPKQRANIAQQVSFAEFISTSSSQPPPPPAYSCD